MTVALHPSRPADIDNEATRRRFLQIIGAAGLLTACATDPAEPLAAGARYPRTVEHQDGPTIVPTQPARIVVVDGRNDLDALLALGVTPAAAAIRFGYLDDADTYVERLYGDHLAGTTILEDGYDLEAVAAATPDLILGQNIGDAYPTMNRIAPTISITFEDWRATMRTIALAVGRESEAEDYIASFDAEVAELAAPDRQPAQCRRGDRG